MLTEAQIQDVIKSLRAALDGDQDVAFQLSRALLALAMEDGTAPYDVPTLLEQAGDVRDAKADKGELEILSDRQIGRLFQAGIADMLTILSKAAVSIINVRL